MALPFLNNNVRKQRDRMLAVDLGSRTTKAVHLQRQGEGFVLCGYVLLDAPIFEKTLSTDLLSEHLKTVTQALDAKSKLLTLTVGVNDAIVRHAEMPRMPMEDMRMVLKLNSKSYLVQDLMAPSRNARLVADHIGPSLVGPANAFEKSMPEVVTKEVVALVDVGF